MQLIGMLDSPYVRRVAIALHYYKLPFEHRSLSVFRDVDTFTQINPIIKALTLVCDDGEILMDSTLILAYLQKLANAQAAENQLDQLPSSDQHPSLLPTALHQ